MYFQLSLPFQPRLSSQLLLDKQLGSWLGNAPLWETHKLLSAALEPARYDRLYDEPLVPHGRRDRYAERPVLEPARCDRHDEPPVLEPALCDRHDEPPVLEPARCEWLVRLVLESAPHAQHDGRDERRRLDSAPWNSESMTKDSAQNGERNSLRARSHRQRVQRGHVGFPRQCICACSLEKRNKTDHAVILWECITRKHSVEFRFAAELHDNPPWHWCASPLSACALLLKRDCREKRVKAPPWKHKQHQPTTSNSTSKLMWSPAAH